MLGLTIVAGAQFISVAMARLAVDTKVDAKIGYITTTVIELIFIVVVKIFVTLGDFDFKKNFTVFLKSV